MHRSFDRTFYHSIFYCLLIYALLGICEEDLLLLHPLIARVSTETAAFVSFRLLPCQRVCFWMHSNIHFCFSSLSFSPPLASPPFVVAHRGLSFAHFCFPHRYLPFSHLLRLPVTIVGFLVVLSFRSLQLLVAIVGLPLINSASYSQC